MRRTTALLGSLMLGITSVTHAQTVVSTTGTPFTTTGLSGFQTLGGELDGLSVQATFSNGTTSGGSFAMLQAGIFGVRTNMFALTIGTNDDTFSNPFTLSNITGLGSNPAGVSLTGLVLSGAAGGLVFDRNLFGSGTPGSSTGADFVFTANGPAGSIATYTNIVSITGQPAVGDIFETISIAFGSGGLVNGASLQFIADVDEAAVGAAVRPTTPSTVPEPSTYVLFASGLGALGLIARRRRA